MVDNSNDDHETCSVCGLYPEVKIRELAETEATRRKRYAVYALYGITLGWDGQIRGGGEQTAVFADACDAASFAEAHGWDVDYADWPPEA